jgi:hypothetical protein
VPDDSLGVIIPERGSAKILAVCLAALETALARVSIRAEVAVVINGSRRADYEGLIARYPGFRFVSFSRPLGFTAAIRAGLRHVTAGWTYLLNNDMWLAEDALSNILLHRGPAVFSLASRITMTNQDAARETNRTGIEFIDGLANLLELDGAATGPVEHFYSGGGSSLFQTEWLRQFVNRTTCYDPFYYYCVIDAWRSRTGNRKVAEAGNEPLGCAGWRWIADYAARPVCAEPRGWNRAGIFGARNSS